MQVVREASPDFFKDGWVHAISSQLVLNNYEVVNGENVCFNVQQFITVAGSGSYFRVQNGGSATFAAGQSVSILPGTTVFSGGYLQAYIVNGGNYCGLVRPAKEWNAVVDPAADKLTLQFHQPDEQGA